MDESHCVDDLRGAVDVSPSHPSGGHGENANKHANVPPSQHDLKAQKNFINGDLQNATFFRREKRP